MVPDRPRILLADDHAMVAEGIRGLLDPHFDVVAMVDNGVALVDQTQTLSPDVVVTDIAMPLLNGIEALHQIRKRNPGVKVVFLTMHEDAAYAERARAAGAAGYVLKQAAPHELVKAVREALAGRTYWCPAIADTLRERALGANASDPDPLAILTPRKRQILQLFAEGHSAKMVAEQVGLSRRTVESHKYEMMEILGLKSSAELVRFAVRHGLASP